MTRIDFYVLPDAGRQAQWLFVCRLLEKICRLGQSAYLHLDSAEDCQQLDQLLWTFRADSFLPHELRAETPADNQTSASSSPIVIGHGQDDPSPHDVLVNLSVEVPEFFSRFERMAEVISNDEAVKKTGREHYRFYQDRGYPLKNHKL